MLERIKTQDQTNKSPSKIVVNGFLLKNASLSNTNYLEDPNLREFEYKIPSSHLIISKKNYKYPIEVIL